MPSAQNRVRHSASVQELLSFSDRQGVVHARDPTLAVIKVGEPFFRGKIVVVLRPGRIAANLRLVVDGLAESKGAQEIEAMGGSLLSLELKGVVS